MICPRLRPEPIEGTTLVYSYIHIQTGIRTYVRIPEGSALLCNTDSGEWFTKTPLSDPPST